MIESAMAQSLEGVIDIHAHSGPDSIPRKIDGIDLAKLYKARGLRGVVLKNHYEPTASLAFLARKYVADFETFGGIALNLPVGGINPTAVENMVKVAGGWGRFVWMPTFDSENQVTYSKEKRPFVAVSQSGRLLPAVLDVIGIVAKYNLVLATGHSTVKEDLMLVREARKRGVKHIVITHAMMAPIHMSIADMSEAAATGAYIEFVYNGLIGPYKEFQFADYTKAIRAVGVEHCILASDLGQMVNPSHPDGLVEFFSGLKEQGITSAEIGIMSRTNPAKLLELP